MQQTNFYAPFPMYDTEFVKDFERRLDKMIEEYEKVECCNGCKSLYLVDDKHGNTWCGKCNSVNNIEEMKNIEEYLEEYGHIWT